MSGMQQFLNKKLLKEYMNPFGFKLYLFIFVIIVLKIIKVLKFSFGLVIWLKICHLSCGFGVGL